MYGMWWSVLLLLWQACSVQALDPIGTSNGKFVNKRTGSQFSAVGFVYINSNSTSDTVDSLSDPDACLRDAALFQQLGINSIGVTALSTTANHDLCMSIFNSVGIYVAIGLEPFGGVWQDDTPEAHYQTDLMRRSFAIVDAFKDYENTLLFAVNEFSTTFQGYYGATQPILRALIRDVKQYVRKNALRNDIPVGHNMAFAHLDPSLDPLKWEYLAYGLDYSLCTITGDPDEASRPDFLGASHYAGVPDNDTTTWATDRDSINYFSPSFDTFRKAFSEKEYNIPLITPHYRILDNATKSPSDNMILTAVLYGDNSINSIISGGLLLGYANSVFTKLFDWGLVALDREGNLQQREAFDHYASMLALFNLADLTSGAAPTSVVNATVSSCVPSPSAPTIVDFGLLGTTTTYTFANSWDLPTPPPGVEDMIASGVNGQTGSHVDVTQTAVPQTIRDSSGSIISGLQITPSPSAARSRASAALPNATSSSALTHSPNLGTKIGLGVAIPIVVIALIIGALFFLRRRKSFTTKNGRYQKHDAAEMPGEGLRAEVPQYGQYGQERSSEVDGHGRMEMMGSAGDVKYKAFAMEPIELEASEAPRELAGGAGTVGKW